MIYGQTFSISFLFSREPQKCYCGTSVCRGWLGESPDEKTKEEKDEERRKEERDRRKREEKRIYFEDIAVSHVLLMWNSKMCNDVMCQD